MKSQKYDHVPAALSGSGEEFSINLKKKLKEKQQKIAMERRQKEMAELEQCTFKPQVNAEI